MIKRTRILMLTIVTLIVISTCAFTTSKAVDYSKLGVKSGDTATYQFSLSNEEAKRLEMRILNVTGVIVEVNMTVLNSDESLNDTYTVGPVDVSKGQGNIFIFLVCANLSLNDPIFNSPYSPLINETESMTIAGASRTVNYLSIQVSSHSKFNLWWDKPTGITVKAEMQGIGGGPGWQNITLTSTSLWSAGGGGLLNLDTTTVLIIGATATIAVAGAAIAIRIRHKKQPQAAT